MSHRIVRLVASTTALFCLALLLSPGPMTSLSAAPALPPARIVGWNNLGMHCMDGDFSVFSLLPPYNTIHAQLVDPRDSSSPSPRASRVTYEAVADPDRLDQHDLGRQDELLGPRRRRSSALDPRAGRRARSAYDMPGAANTPQTDDLRRVASNWWIAEGIPITPYDDARPQESLPADAPRRHATRRPARPRQDRHRPAGLRRDGLPRLPRLGLRSRGPAGGGLGERRRPRSATTG